MRMVWKTMRLRHVGMGFFWACSMLTFRSSILLSGSANTPEYESLVVIVSFVANMTTMLAVAAWVENDPVRIDRLPIWPLPVLVVAGLLLVFAAGRAGGGALLPLLLGGAVVAGVGYGLFWGSWADCYGRMHPARTSFYLPVTFLLTAALFLAVSLLSENLGVPAIVLMLPLPLASYACLLRCRAEQPDGRAAPSGGTRRSLAALGSLLGLIVASLVLSCLFGFVWELTVFSVGSVNEAHLSPLVANLAVAAALVGLVLYARTRINLDLAYRIIVPVIVVLFAVLPFFWETNPVALNIIMSASYGLFDVIIWSLVAACSYDFAVSGYIVGGIVRSLSVLLRLVGMGIGFLITLVPGKPSALIVGVSIGALYVLVMLGLFNALRRKRRLAAGDGKNRDDAYLDGVAVPPQVGGAPAPVATPADAAAVFAPAVPATAAAHAPAMPAATASAAPEPAPSPAAPEAPTPTAADDAEQVLYTAIAEDYGLTRREAEVLPFLARGRSAKVIAEALFVSESTVRTHIRRILEKTDLHSKQQVIDLIERYG
ncbi:helix-turn-helix transcriptional regulator [Gordonibacter urolithinfaciens]|jgi:DNA-binding CsgD family transcriptional regulator|nr:helix-turn-helix transcriptional regulator [Gordonibacter urolithinfaciens]MBS6974688.1 helix-turn-helix transcriptional regulator [Eggerthellaceae bacterium]MCB6560867.1 helix-turn-helix transcriptional regulator [Gordonibacter urolithinfaciens]MCB7084728.1 helix-turn-helix transcriptional regulator [Gordonibacter urolithinfaciens]